MIVDYSYTTFHKKVGAMYCSNDEPKSIVISFDDPEVFGLVGVFHTDIKYHSTARFYCPDH